MIKAVGVCMVICLCQHNLRYGQIYYQIRTAVSSLLAADLRHVHDYTFVRYNAYFKGF